MGTSRRWEGGLTCMLTDPSSFDSSPSKADSREDFPAPTGPTIARRQPWGTVRLILETERDAALVRPSLCKSRTGEPQTQPVCPVGHFTTPSFPVLVIVHAMHTHT